MLFLRSFSVSPCFQTAVVTKTRSRQTIGHDQPGLENWGLLRSPRCNIAFQRRFLPVLASQLSGRFFSSLCPCPVGPRDSGQPPASMILATNKSERAEITCARKRVPVFKGAFPGLIGWLGVVKCENRMERTKNAMGLDRIWTRYAV